MPQKSEKILNTAQMARFLGISPETVARWCKQGRLPGFKIGGQWRIRMSDFQALVKKKVEGTLRRGEEKKLF